MEILKYLIRCLRCGLALKQISGKGKGQLLHRGTMFFFCWKLLLDAAGSFRFLFFQLFQPEDVLWTGSSIYNAAMHSPCTVADDFDHQLAAGQKLWTFLTLSFRFFIAGLNGYILAPTL